MGAAAPNYGIILAAGDMSSATLTSDPFGFELVRSCGLQATWTGNAVGTLIVQVSNDGANWTTYPGSSYPVTTAGSQYWQVTESDARVARVQYTRSSGSGNLVVTASSKGGER